MGTVLLIPEAVMGMFWPWRETVAWRKGSAKRLMIVMRAPRAAQLLKKSSQPLVSILEDIMDGDLLHSPGPQQEIQAPPRPSTALVKLLKGSQLVLSCPEPIPLVLADGLAEHEGETGLGNDAQQ